MNNKSIDQIFEEADSIISKGPNLIFYSETNVRSTLLVSGIDSKLNLIQNRSISNKSNSTAYFLHYGTRNVKTQVYTVNESGDSYGDVRVKNLFEKYVPVKDILL